MTDKTFLVEIGTEELPPKALRTLAESFAANVLDGLNAARADFESVQWFAAPRRLALKVSGLSDIIPGQELQVWGPPARVAVSGDDLWLLKPGIAFVEKTLGIKLDTQCLCTLNEVNDKFNSAISLETEASGKERKLFALVQQEDKKIASELVNIIGIALSKLPIPKLMRWGDNDTQFVRPVHTVTLLLGDELIPGTVLGIDSARTIRGHRFMGEPEFTIDNADQYPQILQERGKVIADYDVRKAKIKADAEEAARKIGGNADLSDSLLEEVTSLVEWPVVLTAKFEEKFLAVPAEALVYTMKGDQKYFPVYDNDGKLMPNFIFVANIESKDPQQIIAGNEKVVRPRLADAEFFFNTDRKKTPGRPSAASGNRVVSATVGDAARQDRPYRGINRLGC